jgi:hypothetical protein
VEAILDAHYLGGRYELVVSGMAKLDQAVKPRRESKQENANS